MRILPYVGKSPSMAGSSSQVNGRMILPSFLSFFCLFWLLPVSSRVNEVDILLNLTIALRSPQGSVFATWLPGNSPCSFSGITCDSHGLVLEIDLSKKALSGELPVDSLCELKSLQKLSFGRNSLHGTVSTGLNKCVQLRYLNLAMNKFSGPFPDLSSLTELRYLFLESNEFSGTFPWRFLESTRHLIHLAVGDSPLDSSPFPEEVLGLYNLDLLYISNCSIEGRIPPGIGGLSELMYLGLPDNNITGEIPPSIGNLTNLRVLEVYNNRLTGMLPVGFRNLVSLEFFDASNNNLQGDLSELAFLTGLMSLQLHRNKFAGAVPKEFGELRWLVNLTLHTNQLTGQLPSALGLLAGTIVIDVAGNSLSGPIPAPTCAE